MLLARATLVPAAARLSSIATRPLSSLTRRRPPSQDHVYEQWRADPVAYWTQQAQELDIAWTHFDAESVLRQRPLPGSESLDDGFLSTWFGGSRLNMCYNAVDKHVQEGRGEQVAIAYESPVTGTSATVTYSDLLERVQQVAGGLAARGVEPGDRVLIYQPEVPEAIISMLATARLGAIHSVVFGGFAANELAGRISHAQPKVILSATCGVEPTRVVEYKPLLDRALELSGHEPACCAILMRNDQLDPAKVPWTHGRDLEWDEFLAAPGTSVPPADLDGSHPLYTLYTSGTTGSPKGVVRSTGGHAVALKWAMSHVFDSSPGDCYWAASSLGWVVGHSFECYGPLLQGCASVLYEGKPVGTPDAGAFWRVVEKHNVRTLFAAPTAVRAIRREDPNGSFLDKHDTSSLNALFVAGERCDPDTLKWIQERLPGVHIVDNYWQTETGTPMVATALGVENPLPVKPGSAGKPLCGYDFRVLDEEHRELPPGTTGDLVVKLPLPPGTLPTLWGNDELFVEKYLKEHPGYYSSGDSGLIDEDGYVHIMQRTDDVINVAGHRLSTGGIEEVVAKHPAVAEVAVVGADDELKGHVPVAFVVVQDGEGVTDAAQLEAEVVQLVRTQIGAIACLREVHVVANLPKTRSGKVLRRTLREIINHGQAKTVPATIEDASVLDALATQLSGR